MFVTFVGLAVLLALESCAEFSLKKWADAPHSLKWIISGIGLYALVGLTFAIALRIGGAHLALMNALWQAMNIVVVTGIAVVVFGETLSKIQWIGIVLAALASLCLLA